MNDAARLMTMEGRPPMATQQQVEPGMEQGVVADTLRSIRTIPPVTRTRVLAAAESLLELLGDAAREIDHAAQRGHAQLVAADAPPGSSGSWEGRCVSCDVRVGVVRSYDDVVNLPDRANWKHAGRYAEVCLVCGGQMTWAPGAAVTT
jgi:hypothetical protein